MSVDLQKVSENQELNRTTDSWTSDMDKRTEQSKESIKIKVVLGFDQQREPQSIKNNKIKQNWNSKNEKGIERVKRYTCVE